jgi:hypothetical protein
VLLYRFEWAGFAATPGTRIEIGDALFGFDIEDEGSALFVRWPAGFSAERVTPAPDERRDRTVVWQGPVEFGPGEPRVVVAGGWLRLVPRGPAVLVAGAALVVVAGLSWRRAGGLAVGLPTAGSDGAAANSEANADADGGEGDEKPAEGGDEETGEAGVPAELLSDEERVLKLLEANGGRLKQQDVVAELGWSETKTSQVVTDLREAEKVEVYRIGRENVVSLPGEMDV